MTNIYSRVTKEKKEKKKVNRDGLDASPLHVIKLSYVSYTLYKKIP